MPGTFRYSANVSDVQVMLRSRIAKLGNDPVMRSTVGTAVLEWLQHRTAVRFQNQGGSEVGGSWPALAPSTALKKGTDEINIDSGALEGWLTSSYGNVTSPVTSSLLIQYPLDDIPNSAGTDGKTTSYALYNAQLGTAPGSPERPVVGVDEKDQAFVMEQVMDWLELA